MVTGQTIKTMEPSIKEIKSLKNVAYFLGSVVVILAMSIVFVFAKATNIEYRPIVTTIVSRSLNTAYQPSTSRSTLISISSSITSSITLTGGASGTISLQTSPDNITYTTVAQQINNNTGTVVIGIATNNAQATNLVTVVPPTFYYKLVTSTGTPASTFAALPGTETSL